MTTVLEPTEIAVEQAASNGRFFETTDSLTLERAWSLSDLKADSEVAAAELAALPKSDLDGWQRDPVQYPHVDSLITRKNIYGDAASLVGSAGRQAVRGILGRPPDFEWIGQNYYHKWTDRFGRVACLATSDATAEPLILFSDNDKLADPANNVRLATLDDYARLVINISLEQTKHAAAA